VYVGVYVKVGVYVGVYVAVGVYVGVCVAVGVYVGVCVAVGVYVGVGVGARTKNSIKSLQPPANELSLALSATTLKTYALPGVSSKLELNGEVVTTPPAAAISTFGLAFSAT
jgi:hypothetical protein